MDICGPEVVLGDTKHGVGLPETKIVFDLVTDVDEKSEVRRYIEEKTTDLLWSVPSDLLLLPSQRGKTNVLVDGHRYNFQRKGKVYDKWRCAQYNKKKKSTVRCNVLLYLTKDYRLVKHKHNHNHKRCDVDHIVHRQEILNSLTSDVTKNVTPGQFFETFMVNQLREGKDPKVFPNFKQLRTTMYRRMSASFGKVPKSVKEVTDIPKSLQETVDGKPFLQIDDDTDGERMLIFTDDVSLHI